LKVTRNRLRRAADHQSLGFQIQISHIPVRIEVSCCLFASRSRVPMATGDRPLDGRLKQIILVD